MQKIYFTVGPSQILPSVAGYIEHAITEDVLSMNHRSAAFSSLYRSVDTGLKELFNIPTEYSIFFVSSGTEAMERVIENGVEKISAHFIEGKFGDRFYEVAQELGRDPIMFQQQGLSGFDWSKIELPKDVELLAFTHNDTSTGIELDMKQVCRLRSNYPDALVVLDVVSSIPYVDIDYSHTDCVFFSVQKGFGLPAGLGILVVSPRAIQQSRELKARGVVIGTYHSYPTLQKSYEQFQTPETPNVLGIYLLDKVVKEFLEVGAMAIREQTEQKAEMLYNFFSSQKGFRPLIDLAHLRSNTTLVVEVERGSKELIDQLDAKGIVVGSGYGEHKNDHIRIANFPAHSMEDIDRLIITIEEILRR